MSDIRYNGWLHRSGTGGVWQDSSGRVGIGTSVGMNCSINSGPNALTFGTGTTPVERVRITSAGKVGINQATPEALLHIEAGSSGATYTANAADTLILERDGACVVDIRTTAAVEGGIVFSDNSARAIGRMLYNHNENSMNFTTNSIERLVIRVDGNVSIASSLAVAGVCTAAAFVPSGAEQQLGHRNVWMNGAAQIAQRGASQTSISSYSGTPTGGPDRVSTLVVANHGTWTFSQDSDGPPGFAKCYNLTATTGDGSVASNAAVRWWQKFEGQNLQRFMKGTASAKQFTLSFWVKSTTTGAYAVELLDYDNSNRGVTRTYTISQAATWEYKTITFPADTTGAFDNDNAASFAIEFWLVAGSDYTSGGADASWHAYNDTKRAGGHTANAGGSNNDYHRVTCIQLEAGGVATPYEHKSIGEELAACQRYYQRFPSMAADNYGPIGTGRIRNATNAHIIVYFPEMRTSPTVTKSGDLRILHAATSATVNSVASSHMTRNVIFIEGIVASGLTQGEGCMMTADNDSDGKITLSAEL